jgi:nicotinamide mononucleotide (NMN) deamidase PncC
MPRTIETLAGIVGARLKSSGVMLATAESCTGGWVSQAVTAIELRSETRHYAGDREGVRRQAVIRALQGAIERLDVRGLQR